ncbi:MAG TPA: nascent polypeptide-associated complex protein [Candidatus Thermoplasmatota archaeon]|nr:nascent polypeptide-associated complex protein [Candidatus Thermoplasmatota archaeon]
MFPGMGGRGMNPKQLAKMMKQFGIDMEEIPDVTEVIIRTPKKEYVFKSAEVSIMTAQGQKTYQITGTPEVRAAGGTPAPATAPAAAAEPAGPLFSDEDVDLVASQAGVSKDKARKALEETKGETAEAILKLMGE